MTAYPALLVTGARGQLGTDLVAAAAAAGITAQGFGSRGPGHHRRGRGRRGAWPRSPGRTATTSAGVVINAAAYTAVDEAETDAERAYAVNAAGRDATWRRPRARGTASG